MSSSKNLDAKKTSFLNKSNSAFIEQMYLKFINKDPELPQSWKDYFKDLNEDSNLIINEINGPSWQRNKKLIKMKLKKKILLKKKNMIQSKILTNRIETLSEQLH